MYTSWGKFLLVAVLMVAGDSFANFVTLQLGTLLLQFNAVVAFLHGGSFLVTTVLSRGRKHVNMAMNRDLQKHRTS